MAVGPGRMAVTRSRRRRAEHVMLTPYFHSDRLMAEQQIQNATPGQLSVCVLFNNSTFGEYLHVVGLNVIALNANALAAAVVIPTRANVGLNPNVTPCDPNTPTLFGVCGAGTVTVSLGPQLWEFGCNNRPDHWPYPWPLCILAPGTSLVVECDTSDVTLVASFNWLVLDHT